MDLTMDIVKQVVRESITDLKGNKSSIDKTLKTDMSEPMKNL